MSEKRLWEWTRQRGTGFLAIAFLVALLLAPGASEAKKKYNTWQEVAADMSLEFDAAREDIEAERYRDAQLPDRKSVV